MGGSPEDTTKPRGGRIRRARGWLTWVLLLAALAVWFDRDGWRRLAEWGTGRLLPKVGLEGTVRFEGRLSAGKIRLAVEKLAGEGAVRQIELRGLEVRYRPGRALLGELESVRLSGLRVVVDPTRSRPAAREKTPFDLERFAGQLRAWQRKIAPVEIEAAGLAVEVAGGGRTFYTLAPSSLRHRAGGDEFRISLGDMRFANGASLAAQEATLVWAADRLALDGLRLAPGLELRSVDVALPATGGPAFSGELRANAARLVANGTLERASLRLAEGELVATEFTRLFGVEIPADGRLVRLEAEARGLRGGLKTIEGRASVGLRDAGWRQWRAEAAEADVELRGETAAGRADLVVEGEPVKVAVETTLDRDRGFFPKRSTARVTIARAGTLAGRLRKNWMDEVPAEPVPEASLEAVASADFGDGRILRADGGATAVPLDPDRPSVRLDTRWSWEDGFTTAVRMDGSDASMTFGRKRYRGRANFAGFSTDRANGWLRPFGVGLPAGMSLVGSWEGEGAYHSLDHQGRASIGDWRLPAEGGPVTVSGAIAYDWPAFLEISGLTAVHGNQRIVTNARLQDRLLALNELHWLDGDQVLLSGKASVPVTENPADWRGLLRQTRPLAIDVESRELPLARLHPFLPESTRFPESTRGVVTLHVSGTPAAPEIQGKILVRDLGVASRPELPKGELDLNFRTAEGKLELAGTLLTPGYPAAVLTASTPFRPGEWLDHPELLETEKLQAAAHLPDVDLARFAALLPGVKSLGGIAKGDFVVGGTLAKPEPRGDLELKGGSITLANDSFPEIRGINLKAHATPAAVELERLAVDAGGGTLDGRGRLALDQGKVGNLELTLRGKALPVKRDDSMIVRANVDLAVRGPWDAATISGTVAVVDSLYYRDIEILPIGVPFNRPAVPKLPSIDAAKPANATAAIPEPFRSWKLAVKGKTANPFLIRGNFATGEATLDVDIGGTLGAPAPRGQARLSGVSARLPFSTLVLEEGTIDFRPEAPFDPTLNLRGRSRIRPYEVNLFVYGPVSDPKVLTTSNPPLPENEIMTLLATGTTTRGIEDQQAAMTRGAQLLVEELRRGRIRNTRWLQPLLKLLDRVDFQIGEENPYSGQRYNAATINLDDQWLITAGVSEQGNSRILLMYLIRFR